MPVGATSKTPGSPGVFWFSPRPERESPPGDPAMNEPVTSDLPVLLLAGTFERTAFLATGSTTRA